jgi:hypothetical protein
MQQQQQAENCYKDLLQNAVPNLFCSVMLLGI